MFEDFKALRVTEKGPVLNVQLNSPGTGNAVNGIMLDDLLAVLGSVHDRPDIRVLVLSGAGESFSLGGDRREFAETVADDPTGTALRVLGGKARRVCEALSTLHAVTIARLHGQVIGAGMALALFCDLRAGAENTRFRLPEAALGMPMAWGGALPRLVSEMGVAGVRELMLTGDSFDAVRAKQLSILHRIVPEDDLDEAIHDWTKPIVRRSAAALRVTKTLLNSYAAAHRLADVTLLDPELLASVMTARRA
jgi:methylglutaconyl-CoA hydratase